jgi:hypothetical protein
MPPSYDFLIWDSAFPDAVAYTGSRCEISYPRVPRFLGEIDEVKAVRGILNEKWELLSACPNRGWFRSSTVYTFRRSSDFRHPSVD